MQPDPRCGRSGRFGLLRGGGERRRSKDLACGTHSRATIEKLSSASNRGDFPLRTSAPSPAVAGVYGIDPSLLDGDPLKFAKQLAEPERIEHAEYEVGERRRRVRVKPVDGVSDGGLIKPAAKDANRRAEQTHFCREKLMPPTRIELVHAD